MASTIRHLPTLLLGVAFFATPFSYGIAANGSGLETPNTLEAPKDNASGSTIASADIMEGSPETKLILRGNAEVRQPGISVKGDLIEYTQATDEVRALGNAKVNRSGLQVEAPELLYHLDSQSGETQNAEFEYAPNRLRGEAGCLRFQQDSTVELDDAIITTCKKGDNSWLISFDKLTIDQYTQQGTGHNAVLRLGGVPVFGAPWFPFPAAGERQSGFLTPSIGYSSSRGAELVVPYYFNIAPNYDYTLTPKIYSQSGIGLDNEFRWKTQYFDSQLALNYLFKDKEYNDEKRWGIFGRLNGSYDHFSYGINFNKVSDKDYLSDFGSGLKDSEDDTLAQDFWVTYARDYWNAKLAVRKNQTLNGASEPYEKVPQFTWNAIAPDIFGFEFNTVLDATRFKHPTKTEGDRFVIDQTVSYPMRGAGWFVTPKAEFIGTWYKLEQELNGSKSPSRFTPIASLDAGLIFEREFGFRGRDTIQTWEPRIFYAYAPDRDQSDIPLFDSSQSDLNFAQIFSAKSWSGYDRVDEANQLTTAMTTRFIDAETGNEWLRAAFGQRHYFTDYYIDSKGERKLRPNTSHSDLLASVGAKFLHNLAFSAYGQYNPDTKDFTRASVGLKWAPAPRSVMSLYYRKNNTENISDIIDQIDFSTQWPIMGNVSALARLNYSLEHHSFIEALAGFEYEADCWTLRFVAQRYLTDTDKNQNRFFLQLELRGLGSLGKSPISTLRDGIRGFQETDSAPKQFDTYDYYR